MRSQFTSLLIALAATHALSLEIAPFSGKITVEPPDAIASIPYYPPLPPDSQDLVYDSGDHSVGSRNLQNADIIPGWPYWAHQVRFDPIAGMNGPLLEVRYVAAVQWGATADFDLYIRDSGGNEVASLSGLSAVIDVDNWQIVDVSGLGFVPGAAPFSIELRPSTACDGTNGFTIPFSLLGSNRSFFSSDCANPYSSFNLEARDLFVRTVIANDPVGPTLSVENLVAGQTATLEVTGATPFALVGVAYSLAGAGPSLVDTGVCGVQSADLSSPYQVLPLLSADATGTATLAQPIPPAASGLPVWLHAIDLAACAMTNSLSEIIQ